MVASSGSVRVAVLTTETPHHVQFVRKLAERHEVVRVFEECREISADFETHHPFEDDRDRFERESWFDGEKRGLGDFADVETFRDLNEPAAVDRMKQADVDALVVFGTGKLGQPVLDVVPDRIVNLHGANPEKYRGLDTHLWAIYHGEFDELVTTLHRVRPKLEEGGVVLKKPIPLQRGMHLYELRKANTEACIDITAEALDMLRDYKQFISQPQLYFGRYYSFMPSVLKERCVRKFEQYTAAL